MEEGRGKEGEGWLKDSGGKGGKVGLGGGVRRGGERRKEVTRRGEKARRWRRRRRLRLCRVSTAKKRLLGITNCRGKREGKSLEGVRV